MEREEAAALAAELKALREEIAFLSRAVFQAVKASIAAELAAKGTRLWATEGASDDDRPYS